MSQTHPIMQQVLDTIMQPQIDKFRTEAKLARLLQILNDRADTVDGPDGEPKPNEAMSILGEYEGWLQGWIK